MEHKQKEQLRVLLEARKRAEKVLEKRREEERKRKRHTQRNEDIKAQMRQSSQKLVALAEESGLLALAEQAAQQRGGSLKKEVGYDMDYGFRNSNLHRMVVTIEQDEEIGKMRAAYLTLRVTWQAAGAPAGEPAGLWQKAEARVHRSGAITFHNSFFPVLPFIWRRFPHLLEKMLASALDHPRPAQPHGKKR